MQGFYIWFIFLNSFIKKNNSLRFNKKKIEFGMDFQA